MQNGLLAKLVAARALLGLRHTYANAAAAAAAASAAAAAAAAAAALVCLQPPPPVGDGVTHDGGLRLRRGFGKVENSLTFSKRVARLGVARSRAHIITQR